MHGAVAGRAGIDIFMLHPKGRVSEVQRRQMTTVLAPNVHNIAIEGVFDECQDIVKAVSNDLAFKRRHKIGTVNSINWARLVAQVVYYFAGYFRATSHNGQRVSFAVQGGEVHRADAAEAEHPDDLDAQKEHHAGGAGDQAGP